MSLEWSPQPAQAASYRAEEAKKQQKRAQGELDELAGRRRPARLGDGEEPA